MTELLKQLKDCREGRK
jgi:zinc finger protein